MTTSREPLSTSALSRAPRDAGRAVRLWLGIVALMVAATALVGAATRLTGSGLSITEWQPLLGILPPGSEAAWQAAFAKYQAIPQYAQLNRGMSLEAFKTIYWWEWSHRLIARSIGVVFLLPFIIFLVRGAIPRPLVPRLVLVFLLGGLQGAVGWYMVSSGLVDRVDVSQYRLALHLGLAFLILGLLVWTWLDLRPPREAAPYLATTTPTQRTLASVLLGLTFLQVLLGALVAGLKAGRTFNTWPLMDGAFVPAALLQQSPGYRDLFENAATVQFNHRMAAYVLVALASWQALSVVRSADDGFLRVTAGALAALVLAQTLLGIWTLLAWVPLSLGLAHQAGALAVFIAAVTHRHTIGRAA